MKTLTSIIIALLIAVSALAQTVVPQTSKIKDENLQKKSPIALNMKKGQSRNIYLFVLANNVYNIELIAPKKLKNINFVIINENEDIIYDNAIASFNNSATIYPNKNEKLTLQIITQPAKALENTSIAYDLQLQISFVTTSNPF